MKSFMTWFFKFLWWLTFVVLAAVVLALVYREWIVRDLAEMKIRQATGLDAEIGSVSFNLLEPKLTLVNLKLYNSADFGGTLFMDVPEAHFEFDRAALRRHELHIMLLRVNVSEMDVVKNASGVTNIFVLAQSLVPKKEGGRREFSPVNGYTFTGIDTLNLSLGTIKFIDLKSQLQNRNLSVRVQNKIINNVKTPASLNAFGGQLWLEGAYLAGLPVNKPAEAAPPKTP